MLLLVLVLVSVVGHPWALHMGGRWTPAMVWHGYGTMRASTGAKYALWLNIGPMAMASRKSGKRDNFQGTAVLCTPQGQALTLDVFGKEDGWLVAEGMKMVVTSQRGVRPVLTFRLSGHWKGSNLLLDDGGSMADSFRADGSPKGYAQGPRAPTELTSVTLQYAKKAEFEAGCGGAQSSF